MLFVKIIMIQKQVKHNFQMEYELCVPSEPVLVSHNKSDPVTDEIVQNLVRVVLFILEQVLSSKSLIIYL